MNLLWKHKLYRINFSVYSGFLRVVMSFQVLHQLPLLCLLLSFVPWQVFNLLSYMTVILLETFDQVVLQNASQFESVWVLKLLLIYDYKEVTHFEEYLSLHNWWILRARYYVILPGSYFSLNSHIVIFIPLSELVWDGLLLW